MYYWLASQSAAQSTTIITLLLSLGLSFIITRKHLSKPSKPLMFWSTGLWLFSFGVLLEVMFTFNIYSNFLIGLYLFDVALIVQFLALGSIQFVKGPKIRKAYYIYCAATTLILLACLLAAPQGNLLLNYVVEVNPSIAVIIASSLVTFPAAIVLAVIAYKSYRQSHNARLLSIIVGVIMVSIAGTLYIVQYPAFLYLAELVGIMLLWYGFL